MLSTKSVVIDIFLNSFTVNIKLGRYNMSKTYTVKDFTFIPEEEREIAVDLINNGIKSATHSTKNSGSWEVPIPSDELVKASIEHILHCVRSEEGKA
jgi:hypothetical protein